MRMICDGTYDGLLTALFYAYRARPDEILLRPARQLDMLEQPYMVRTDITRSARVQIAIEEKLSVNSALNVRMVYATAREDAGTLIYRYVMRGWQLGHALDDHMTDPAVEPVLRLSRRVQVELHRMLGFIRFAPLANGVLYAACEPDNDIVPHMIEHFAARLPEESFIIHDLAHDTLAFHKPGRTMVTHARAPRLIAQNDEYADMWRAFYDAICIDARRDERRRDGVMPRRYHRYLTELNGAQGAPAVGMATSAHSSCMPTTSAHGSVMPTTSAHGSCMPATSAHSSCMTATSAHSSSLPSTNDMRLTAR